MTTNNAINNRLGDIFLPHETNLVALDITGMFVTPVDLGLPLPGANKYYNVEYWIATRGTGTAYTGGGNLQLIYTTSGAVLSSVITGNVMTVANPQIGLTNISNTAIPLADMLNNGLSIKNLTAPFAGGGAPGRIFLRYSIVEVP